VSEPVVEVEQLGRTYDAERGELAVRAVADVSFRVERGESVAIIGPSGCGKSTLLHLLGCLDRPTTGRYRLAGRDVATLSEDERAGVRNRHIGFVFQSFHLLPRETALQNVALPLRYAGEARPEARAREALRRVGLQDRERHLPNELSGGQRQRVAIARALVTRPSILLCDEPTGALDSRTGRDVLALLRELGREGTTLLVVTHDLAVARSLDRAIWMRDGLVAEDGPSHAVVDAFVAASGEEAP